MSSVFVDEVSVRERVLTACPTVESELSADDRPRVARLAALPGEPPVYALLYQADYRAEEEWGVDRCRVHALTCPRTRRGEDDGCARYFLNASAPSTGPGWGARQHVRGWYTLDEMRHERFEGETP